MIILGFETSTPAGSVAIVEDRHLLGERRWKTGKGHAERLIQEVDHLLKELSIPIKAVDGYAVTVGPGSFTGLRVSLATVKGLAMAMERPVVPVSTLEALARNVPASLHPAHPPAAAGLQVGQVCPLLDAGREEVYAALFRRDGKDDWTRLLPDQIISAGDLLKQLSRPTLFIGEGAARYETAIRRAMGKDSVFAAPEMMEPSAATVAGIGLSRLLRGETAQAKEVVPVYLRRPDAQVKLEKAQREKMKHEKKKGLAKMMSGGWRT
jgi:tRNA threonylcarbamoyladenosine biosynthesis protein TsaB